VKDRSEKDCENALEWEYDSFFIRVGLVFKLLWTFPHPNIYVCVFTVRFGYSPAQK